MTLQEFAAQVASLQVDGVKTAYRFGQVPTSFAAATLPAQFVDLPESTDAPVLFRGGWWPEYRIDLVVVVSPIGRGRLGKVQQSIVKMMDAVSEAVRTLGTDVQYEIRPHVMDMENAQYYAVRATVIKRGGE